MAKSDKPKPIYAPIPARAIGDQKLTALDFRVLAALAAHDRLGANGIGCYASHTRLATLVGCHVKSLSRSLATLAGGTGGAQYIEPGRHPLNARLRVYRVRYSEFDGAYLKGGIGNEPATDQGSKGNELGNDGEGVGNTEPASLVTDSDEVPDKDQSVSDVNIFSETVKYPVQTVWNRSREAGSGEEAVGVSAMLSMIQRAVSSRDNRKNHDFRKYLEQLLNGEIQAGNASKARAARILQEMEAAA